MKSKKGDNNHDDYPSIGWDCRTMIPGIAQNNGKNMIKEDNIEESSPSAISGSSDHENIIWRRKWQR